MKRMHRLPSGLFVLLGIVLGMIPPTTYHLIVTRQPPAPVTFWDSRPCCADPGPLTCDEILPYAPYDYLSTHHGEIPGAQECIEKPYQEQAALSGPPGDTGTVVLWWLPACQSAFASVTFAAAGNMLAVQLIFPVSENRYDEAQRLTMTTARGRSNGSTIFTTLVWVRPGSQIIACASVTFEGEAIYRACTKTYRPDE